MFGDPYQDLLWYYDAIGPEKAKNLLSEFGSIEALEEASKSELTSVDKVGPVTASNLMNQDQTDARDIDYDVPESLDVSSFRKPIDEDANDGDIHQMVQEIDEEEPLEGNDTQRIARIRHVFRDALSTEVIAQALDVDSERVRKVEWNPDEERARLTFSQAWRDTFQFTEKQRKEIRAAYAGCVLCGVPRENIGGLSVHHILGEKRRGSSRKSNGVPLCEDCHSEVSVSGAAGKNSYDTAEEFWEMAEMSMEF